VGQYLSHPTHFSGLSQETFLGPHKAQLVMFHVVVLIFTNIYLVKQCLK
jgi:hypothetical protein